MLSGLVQRWTYIIYPKHLIDRAQTSPGIGGSSSSVDIIQCLVHRVNQSWLPTWRSWSKKKAMKGISPGLNHPCFFITVLWDPWQPKQVRALHRTARSILVAYSPLHNYLLSLCKIPAIAGVGGHNGPDSVALFRCLNGTWCDSVSPCSSPQNPLQHLLL